MDRRIISVSPAVRTRVWPWRAALVGEASTWLLALAATIWFVGVLQRLQQRSAWDWQPFLALLG